MHSLEVEAMAAEAKQNLEPRFGVQPVDREPRVFYRIIDNCLELTVASSSARTRSATPRTR